MIDDPSLHQVLLQLVINLHPAQSGNILAGVHTFLNGLLLSWSDDLDGVAICYSGERVTSSQAPLHAFFSYLQVTVRATFLLYKPVDDQLQCGRVSKVGSDFLALLVLGVFSVAIGANEIRDDLQPDDQAGRWQSVSRPEHSITEGDLVRFTVLRSSHDAGIFSLQGSLLDPATGSTVFLDAQQAHKPRKAKKRRPAAAAAQSAPEQPPEELSNGDLVSQQPVQAPQGLAGQAPAKPRKAKRKKSASAGDDPGTAAGDVEHAQQGTGEEQPNKKRKKKQRGSAAASDAVPEATEAAAAAAELPAADETAAAAPTETLKKKKPKKSKGPAAQTQPPAQLDDAPTQGNVPPQSSKPKHRQKAQKQAGPLQGQAPSSKQQQEAEGSGSAAPQSPSHRKHKRRKQAAENGTLSDSGAGDAGLEAAAVASGQQQEQKHAGKKKKNKHKHEAV